MHIVCSKVTPERSYGFTQEYHGYYYLPWFYSIYIVGEKWDYYVNDFVLFYMCNFDMKISKFLLYFFVIRILI